VNPKIIIKGALVVARTGLLWHEILGLGIVGLFAAPLLSSLRCARGERQTDAATTEYKTALENETL
jgi:hypothetical protein